MTDISELREGDEIAIVWRMTVRKGAMGLVAKCRDFRISLTALEADQGVQSITVVHPEIIPGQPYVDADGFLYIGLNQGRVMHCSASGDVDWFGGEGDQREGNLLPSGLRPAQVVPEP